MSCIEMDLGGCLIIFIFVMEVLVSISLAIMLERSLLIVVGLIFLNWVVVVGYMSM